MNFQENITTNAGEIRIVNAIENGLDIAQNESRNDFEARVLKRIVESILGKVELGHESNGAPIVKDDSAVHISISHSDKWFAVYISRKHAVGIDIELTTNQLEKAKHHFLTKTELSRLNPNQKEIQICWGIKETVFKRSRGMIKSLQTEIEIIELTKDTAVVAHQSEKVIVKHKITDVYCLVYSEN